MGFTEDENLFEAGKLDFGKNLLSLFDEELFLLQADVTALAREVEGLHGWVSVWFVLG